jgi:hypothetical protein
MTRLPDWEARLSAYLAEARSLPHAYGSHDCALHGANVVRAITGIDHGAPFRGRYSTARGALKVLRSIGAGTLEATFDAHLPVIPVAFAGRGDLVMAEESIGVCIGGDALFVGAEGEQEGLVRLPRRNRVTGAPLWQKAWRV